MLSDDRALAEKNKGEVSAYWHTEWVGSQTLPSLFPEQSSQIKLQILSLAKTSSSFLCHWLTPGCIFTAVSLWPSPKLQICSEYCYGIWAQTDVKDLLHKLAKPRNRLRECTWTLLIPPRKGKLKYNLAVVALYLTKESYYSSTPFTPQHVLLHLFSRFWGRRKRRMVTALRPDTGTLSLHMRESDPHNTLLFLRKGRGRQRTNLPKRRGLMSCYIPECRFQGQHELRASNQLCSKSAIFPVPYAQIGLILNQQKVTDHPHRQAIWPWLLLLCL